MLAERLSMTKEFELFDRMASHEQVVFCNDPTTGLRAIIAIHNTTLGPALGGCRMQPYNSVEDALEDVLRLSKGMTYKCAAADVDFGGGKAVIIGDPKRINHRSYSEHLVNLSIHLAAVFTQVQTWARRWKISYMR